MDVARPTTTMEKSPELRKSLKEDSEFKFFDSLGNAFDVVTIYVDRYKKKHKNEDLKEIREGKNRFYECLERFKQSGYAPKGKINPESLKRFDEFKNLDWSIDINIEEVKNYIHSLRPKK